ncbi:MAG: nucleotidyltransferase domain-containing protein [Armatimonadota bacterium]
MRRRSVELQRIIPLLADLGAQKVLLFGSVARDRIRATSDLDLIVVMDTDRPFVERVRRIRDAIGPRLACDLLAYTPEEFDEMAQSSLLVRQALREGEVLHEARSEG